MSTVLTAITAYKQLQPCQNKALGNNSCPNLDPLPPILPLIFKSTCVSWFILGADSRCYYVNNPSNRFTLKVQTADDLDRQVIKSEWGRITIPEIELEIPREAQKGSSSTVEGMKNNIYGI